MQACEFRQISKNTFFTEHIWGAASEIITILIVKSFLQLLKKDDEELSFNSQSINT